MVISYLHRIKCASLFSAPSLRQLPSIRVSKPPTAIPIRTIMPSPPPDNGARSPPPPPRSPPRSPSVTPSHREDEAVVLSAFPTTSLFQPASNGHSSAFASSPPRAANNAPPISEPSPPFSGSVSPPAPPAPPSQEPEFSNEQIRDMIRPVLRFLQRRGMLDDAPPAPPPPPNFPEPSVHATTGTGSFGVLNTLSTNDDGRFASITMNALLQNKSFEEIRLEDYNLANGKHPFSTNHNPFLSQPNDDKSGANGPTFSKRVSFRDPPLQSNAMRSSDAPASNGLGSSSNLFKFPWPPLAKPNATPSFDLHPLFSPFSFPSSSQPNFQQPSSQTFAKANNSHPFATNWLGGNASQNDRTSTSFKPHDSQSVFANSSKSFAFPLSASKTPNGIASSFGPPPVHNCFAPTSLFTSKGGQDDGGAVASRHVGNQSPNSFGASGFTRNVTQKQTFMTPAGENHGPVFNEIQVSQTAYYPPGWFC